MARKAVSGEYGWVAPTVLTIGVAAGLYWLFKQLGSFGSNPNNQTATTNTTSAAANQVAADQAAGLTPTMNSTVINSTANTLVQTLTAGDAQGTYSAILNVKNQADWDLVYQEFGTRSFDCTFGLFCNQDDLINAISAELSPSDVNEISNYLLSIGVNVNFTGNLANQ